MIPWKILFKNCPVLWDQVKRKLYSLITRVLSANSPSWWKKIPENIRIDAAKLHEESNCKISKEHALTFTNLKVIVEKNWREFLPYLVKQGNGKSEFKIWMENVGYIRNRVCHPLRLDADPIRVDEVSFVKERLAYVEKLIQETMSLEKEETNGDSK